MITETKQNRNEKKQDSPNIRKISLKGCQMSMKSRI